MRDCVLDEVKRKSVVGAMMDWQIGSEFQGSHTSLNSHTSLAQRSGTNGCLYFV